MKGALLVGIDAYPGSARLFGCVNDATKMAELLETNEDGTANFQAELRNDVKTRVELRKLINRLFQADINSAIFFFSGHGCITERGGFILTPDFQSYDEGVSLSEILEICNKSPIKEKIIILDCCYSGAFGNLNIVGGNAYLGEGVTILTASGKSEKSVESGGHGVFTSLLISALEGGAADLTGNVTAGNIYSFIDRSLGFWQQRPQFKTNVSSFLPLRTVIPRVSSQAIVKKITVYFDTPDAIFSLDPSYEYTNKKKAIAEHVAVFQELQQMQSVGLVEPDGEKHMYWAAQKSKGCKLTMLGKNYWRWAKDKRLH